MAVRPRYWTNAHHPYIYRDLWTGRFVSHETARAWCEEHGHVWWWWDGEGSTLHDVDGNPVIRFWSAPRWRCDACDRDLFRQDGVESDDPDDHWRAAKDSPARWPFSPVFGGFG